MAELDGLDELMRKLEALKQVPNGMGMALQAGAMRLEGHIKASMQTNHTGRVYRRGTRIHQASAAGETPAIDFGTLLNSVGSRQASETSAEVFTSAEYAPMLEFGTAYMEARPFMRPAVDQHEGDVVAAVQATVTRLVEKAAR